MFDLQGDMTLFVILKLHFLQKMKCGFEIKVLNRILSGSTAPFTQERNRSTSFSLVPKSGTPKGCVQTGTLSSAFFLAATSPKIPPVWY